VLWCPKCCYEYRAGIRECPDCRETLVASAPVPPSRIAGIRLEPKTAAALSPLREGFLQGLHIARQAASLLLRYRALLLFVLLLALLYFAANTWQTFRLQNLGPTQFNLSSPLNDALQENLREDFLLSSGEALTRNFASPLGRPANCFLPGLTAGFVLFLRDWEETRLISLLLFFLLTPLSALLLAVLLEHLGAAARSTRARPWREVLRTHFWSLIPLTLVMNLALTDILSRKTAFAGNIHIERWPGIGILLGLSLVLILAPFTLVNRRLGLWGGVKAALEILVRRFWSLAALLVIYGLGFAGILILAKGIDFLSQHLIWPIEIWDNITVLALAVALYSALALLGSWLATCFTLLAAPAEGGRVETKAG
jgi:hypothetical protein